MSWDKAANVSSKLKGGETYALHLLSGFLIVRVLVWVVLSSKTAVATGDFSSSCS